MITYNEMATEIIASECSTWLRDAVVALARRRDCSAALADIQTLEALYDLKVDETLGPVPMCDEATAKLFSDDPDNH